jgi:three-Cys-motif partner protein
MSAGSGFFGQRNAQAVLKHGVLTRYAHYFAGRAGKATGRRVAFIDGYAGEGRYADGSPGSPILLASQAERVKLFDRYVRLALVERDDNRRRQLARSLSEAGVHADQLLGSSLEDAIDGLLHRYADHAVLVFVDPFGLGVSRATLERILRARSRRRPVDILFHFSLSTVARMGRAGIVEGPGSERNAEQLDQALGAIEWRAAFENAASPSGPTEAALTIAHRFGASVQRSTGVHNTAIPVRQRPSRLPKYLLMLFSADQQAHWDFTDVAGLAYVDWLHHCDRRDYEANVAHRDRSGLQELFPEPEPEAGDADAQVGADAASYLPDHILRLLQAAGPIRPVDAIDVVYGDMLGRARVTHLRAALRHLHRLGLVDDDAHGDFWKREISRREG